MFYIRVADSKDSDKWCFLCKCHTWDRAQETIRDQAVIAGKACVVEWATTPPMYSVKRNVY